MSRSTPEAAWQEDGDDGLDDYFAACRGRGVMSSSASDADSNHGESPRRGRAVQHRSSLHKLRVTRAESQPRLTQTAEGSHSFLSEAVLEASRTAPARGLAERLRVPLSTTSTPSRAVHEDARDVAVYRSPVELEAARRTATTDAEITFLIEALCAVRQVETRQFTRHRIDEAGCQWGFSTEVVAAESRASLACSVVLVGQRLLKTADLLADVHDVIRAITAVLERASCAAKKIRKTRDDTRSSDRSAQVALTRAALASLHRFLTFMQQCLHWYESWLMEVEAYLRAVYNTHSTDAAASATSQPPPSQSAERHQTNKTRRVGEPGVALVSSWPTSSSATAIAEGFLLALPLVVEQNADTLALCLRVCAAMSLPNWEDPCDVRDDDAEVVGIGAGRTLVDALITEASVTQDASQLNQFRLYVMLLLPCAWPYVELVLDAFFGRVRGVSAVDWGRQLPLLFRTPLSPTNRGDGGGVDVLSLVLDCVDYPDVGDAFSSREGGADVTAATASSCRYVLRSLSDFAQQRRRSGRHASGRTQGPDGAVLRGGAERSVDDILAELVVNGGGGASGRGGSDDSQDGADAGNDEQSGTLRGETDDAVPITAFLTPQQQRRLRRALPTTQGRRDDDGGHDVKHALPPPTMHLATSLPLGLRTMTHELDHVANGHPSLHRHAAGHTRLAAGMVWSAEVVLEGRVGAPDLALRSRVSGGDEESALSWWCSDAASVQKRRKVIWVDAAIPVTRWVVAAVLVPLSLVAQRIQAHRLTALFMEEPSRGLRSRHHTMGEDALMRALHEGQNRTERGDEKTVSRPLTAGVAPWQRGEQADAGATRSTRYALHRLVGRLGDQARLLVVPPSFSVYAAVKLLMDVALCRDVERVVRRFLERLADDPHWWFRRDAAHYTRDGTASTFISTAFSDALRDKRFGALVSLAVLPASAATEHGHARVENEENQGAEKGEEPGGDASNSQGCVDPILDIFASFQLHFAFPEALAVVFLPRLLSVYMENETGALQRTYTSAFWQHRQGLVAKRTTAQNEAAVAALRLQTTVSQRGGNTVAPARQPAATTATSGAFSDIWSYVFGYLCSLQYAQIALRRLQKEVQQQEAQDKQLLASMGGQSAASQRLRRVSRGLGSVFFTLSFAVDTLLTFAQREGTIFIDKLEHILMRGKEHTVGSTTSFCQEIDALLLDLFLVSFPVRQPAMHTAEERMAISATSEAVRDAVTRVLQLALSPTHAPPSMMSARVHNAVDALVVIVQSLRDATVLKARLQPLVALFTFNRFYGVDQHTPSYRFR